MQKTHGTYSLMIEQANSDMAFAAVFTCFEFKKYACHRGYSGIAHLLRQLFRFLVPRRMTLEYQR